MKKICSIVILFAVTMVLSFTITGLVKENTQKSSPVQNVVVFASKEKSDGAKTKDEIKFKSKVLKICKEYLTNPDLCSSRIRFTDDSKKYGTTYLYWRDGVFYTEVLFSRETLKLSENSKTWIIYHELSHVEQGSRFKDEKGFKGLGKKAQKRFSYHVIENGQSKYVELKPSLSLEILTDCMTYDAVGKRLFGMPYYFTQSMKTNSEQKIRRECSSWKNILADK